MTLTHVLQHACFSKEIIYSKILSTNMFCLQFLKLFFITTKTTNFPYRFVKSKSDIDVVMQLEPTTVLNLKL